MPPIQYIGRTTDFKGKTLWEILGNLKNHGTGRLIIRGRFQRYSESEPCFVKVMKVAALPNEEVRNCAVLVEKTFRGKKSPELLQIDTASYKADYQLVPKDEEHKYLRPVELRKETVLSKTMELPPALREIMIRGLKAKGESVDKDPEMEIQYNIKGTKFYRVANEAEKYDVKPVIGLGKPSSPGLYANVQPI